MDPSETTVIQPSPSDFDPRHQTFYLYGPDGMTEIPISVDDVNFWTYDSISVSISYGAQLGACVMMLIVLLTLSPSLRAVKMATVINMASLLVNIVRMILLAQYFMSPFQEFYTYYSDDYRYVPDQDYHISVATNTLAVVQLLFIEAALILQAWTVVKLWRNPVKFVLFVISTAVALMAVAWRFAFCVIINQAALSDYEDEELAERQKWVQEATLITNTISICYFCALFSARLAHHMWQNRSFLPNTSTLTAMDVLVMTNGVLLVVPGKFGANFAFFFFSFFFFSPQRSRPRVIEEFNTNGEGNTRFAYVHTYVYSFCTFIYSNFQRSLLGQDPEL